GDAAVGDERDHLFHRVPGRTNSIEIDLLDDDLLEVHRRRLLGDAADRDTSAFADHPDRLPDRGLGTGRLDGDVGPQAARHLADPGRLRVVTVLAMAEVLSTVVEAQVVATGSAHPAVAAARVARPGDARSRAEAVGGRDLARLDDFAGPLVAGYERVGAGPAPLEGSL